MASPPETQPEPEAAPPQPAPVVMLLVLKNTYNLWIAAGGTPPIYGPVPPSQSVSFPQ